MEANNEPGNVSCNSSNDKEKSSEKIFVNHAEIAWQEMRKKWVGDPSNRTSEMPAEPVIGFNATYENFGNSIGTTHLVDTIKGRIQVTVQADAPLRFNKSAQLQTGEIVKVKLFYEKLFRWCIHCRRICHEFETCPLLDDNQRALLSSANGDMHRSQSIVPRPDKALSLSGVNRQDRSRNVAGAPVSRPASSRYPHQSSHRRSQNPAPQASRPNLPQKRSVPSDFKRKSVEEGRKRRFDDSFRQEDVSESSRRGRGASFHKESSSLSRGREEPSAISDSQLTVSDPILFPPRAKQGFESPAMVSERPFRLNLAKRLSSSEKGKGKEICLPENSPNSTETGSSAKKSLNFLEQDQVLGSSASLKPLILPCSVSQPEKEKSWYEITMEEEEKERKEDPEAFLAKQFSQSVSFASPGAALLRKNPNPSLNAAETDWIGNSSAVTEALQLDWTAEDEVAYNALDSPRFSDEDDFVDDDLLGEELQVELQSRPVNPPISPDVSTQVKNLSVKLKSTIVAASGSAPEEGEASQQVLGSSRPKSKRKESKRKEGAQNRRNLQISAHLINAASKKIQNIKGRSPSKRVSSKSGPPKPRSSKRLATAPKSGVFPSSKDKPAVSGVSLEEPPLPSDTNT